MDVSGRICRFCMKKSIDYKAIEGYVGENLGKLLLKVDLSKSEEPVMCVSCAEMLKQCFDYKEMCCATHKDIVAFVDNKAGVKLDLKNVYLSKQENDVVFHEDQKICGICMGLVASCSTVYLESEEGDVIKKILENYLPELDFGIINKPVICAVCQASLWDYYSFITNCLIVEEHINKFCKATDINDKGQIKLNDLLQFISQNLFAREEDDEEPSIIKTEQIFGVSDDDNDESKTNCMKLNNQNVNDVCQHPSKSVLVCMEDCKDFDCDKIKEEFTGELETKIEIDENCIETKDRRFYSCGKEENEAKTEQQDMDRSQDDAVLQPEVPTKNHENPSETIYHCDSCLYQTTSKDALRSHMTTHKGSSETVMYICEMCSFKSKFKRNLVNHMIVHKSPSETPMYTCGLCSYKTKFKGNLTKHMVAHKSPSETHIYNCDWCSYKSKFKQNFKRHMVAHKIPSETRMYCCDLCSFKSKYRNCLAKHMKTHRKSSETPIYACDLCLFKSKYKCNLLTHMVTHMSPSATPMYACDLCTFKSKYKISLRCHVISHTSSSDTQIYNCDLCSFKSKYKGSLTKHMVVHKVTSDTFIHTCDLCPYKSKCKAYLLRHMITHKSPSDIRMYTCDLCSFKSKYKGSLTKHMVAHKISSKTSMHTCDLCPFKSKYNKCLERHMLTHKSPSETPMYTCNFCPLKTKYKETLLKHMVVHKSLSETPM